MILGIFNIGFCARWIRNGSFARNPQSKTIGLRVFRDDASKSFVNGKIHSEWKTRVFLLHVSVHKRRILLRNIKYYTYSMMEL